MKRKRSDVRAQAVAELMLENNERIAAGQNPNPYWCVESCIKQRMKEIRARPNEPPPGMQPLAFTGSPNDLKK